MDNYCQRMSIQASTVRFLFDGNRVQPEDTADAVRQRVPARAAAGRPTRRSYRRSLP